MPCRGDTAGTKGPAARGLTCSITPTVPMRKRSRQGHPSVVVHRLPRCPNCPCCCSRSVIRCHRHGERTARCVIPRCTAETLREALALILARTWPSRLAGVRGGDAISASRFHLQLPSASSCARGLGGSDQSGLRSPQTYDSIVLPGLRSPYLAPITLQCVALLAERRCRRPHSLHGVHEIERRSRCSRRRARF